MYSLTEETQQYGNVIRGWEGFLNCKPKFIQAGNTRRLGKITDRDRVFTHSSITSPNDESEELDVGGPAAHEDNAVARSSTSRGGRSYKKNRYNEDEDGEDMDEDE